MKLSWEYLAGLFDGEGCVHIPVQFNHKSPNYGIRAIFSLCHKDVIERIAKQFGVSFCRINKSRTNPKWKDAYSVQICGEKAAAFMRGVLPHLLVKQEEVKLALLLQEHVTRYRYIFRNFTPEERAELIAYREGLRQQIRFLRRADASDGMAANSADTPCPVSNDAEGQRRAKLRSV